MKSLNYLTKIVEEYEVKDIEAHSSMGVVVMQSQEGTYYRITADGYPSSKGIAEFADLLKSLAASEIDIDINFEKTETDKKKSRLDILLEQRNSIVPNSK